MLVGVRGRVRGYQEAQAVIYKTVLLILKYVMHYTFLKLMLQLYTDCNVQE